MDAAYGWNRFLIDTILSNNSEYQERYKLRNISILVSISSLFAGGECVLKSLVIPSISFSHKQQIWRQLVLQGVFDLSIDAIAIQQIGNLIMLEKTFHCAIFPQVLTVTWHFFSIPRLCAATDHVTPNELVLILGIMQIHNALTLDPWHVWKTSRVFGDCA